MSDIDSPRWLTHDKGSIKPKEMATTHLFNTIKMIWNHTVPEDMKLKPYKKYKIDTRVYTHSYISQILRLLLQELSTRSDTELIMRDMIRIDNMMKKLTSENFSIEMDK